MGQSSVLSEKGTLTILRDETLSSVHISNPVQTLGLAMRLEITGLIEFSLPCLSCFS